jgi:hypothetical protein
VPPTAYSKQYAANYDAIFGKKDGGVADAGTQQAPGKTDEHAKAAPISAEKAKAIAELFPTLREVLEKDLAEEKQAAKDAQSYSRFKPLVVFLGEASAKLFEGFGYDAKKGEFDAARINAGAFVEGLAILLDCLVQKQKILEPFLQGYKKWLRKVFNRPEEPPAKPDDDPAKKREEAQVEALATLAVAILTLVAKSRMLAGEAPPGEGAEPGEKASKSFSEIAESALKIFGSILTLFQTSYGEKFLGGLGAHLRAKPTLFWADDPEERHRREMERISNVPYEDTKKARDAREKAHTDEEKKSGGEKGKEELLKIAKGMADVITSAIATMEAYHDAFPESLAGEWTLEGLPDHEVHWVARLEKEKGDAYRGAIFARGHPEGEPTNKEKPLEPVEDQRAVCKIEKMPDGRFKFEWTSIPRPFPNVPKVKIAGDPYFAMGVHDVELLELDSTRHLYTGSSAFGRNRSAPDPAAHKGPLHLRRPIEVKKWIDVAGAAFTFFIAIPTALPSRWEKPFRLRLAKMVEPFFVEKVQNPIRAVLPKSLQKYGKIEWKEGKLGFSLDIPNQAGKPIVGFGVAWNVYEILEWSYRRATGEEQKPGTRNPFVPETFTFKFKIEKLHLDADVEWDVWDPTKEQPKGLTSALDALPAWDWRLALQHALKDGDWAIDILPPKLKAGTLENGELPAVELPIVICLRESGKKDAKYWNYFSKSKFTVKLGVGAEALVGRFPQFQALLFAWQMGWAAGTALRGQLLKHESYRQMERDFQQWAAGAAYADRVNEVTQRSGALLRDHLINGVELLLADVKAPYYVWRSVDLKGGYPMEFDRQQADLITCILWKKYKDAQKPNHQTRPRHEWDVMFVPSAAQAALYVYLWGRPRAYQDEQRKVVVTGEAPPTQEQVAERIKQEREENKILESTANLLRYYLYPPVLYRDSESYRLMALQAAREEKTDPLKKIEADRVEALLNRPETGEHIRVLHAGLPDPDHKDAFSIVPRGGDWYWVVERKAADEAIRVRFRADNRTVGSEVLASKDPGASVAFAGRRHTIDGSMGEFRASIEKVKRTAIAGPRKNYNYIVAFAEVVDSHDQEKVLWTSPRWNVWVESDGRVFDAEPVEGAKY